MLIIAKRLRDLSFGKLMDVYKEGNLETGSELWPDEPEHRRIALAEQEFYHYLREVFFLTQDAQYFVWEENGRYLSALRLEPYQDGMLLEALETMPEYRGKGYATQLLLAVLESVSPTKVYSHVGKRNHASLRTHEKCGFVKTMDYSVYADGSVDDRCVTFCSIPEAK